MKHYEQVLALADAAKKKSEEQDPEAVPGGSQKVDLSKEAAYNLSSIYLTRGAPDLARQVVDKYLSL